MQNATIRTGNGLLVISANGVTLAGKAVTLSGGVELSEYPCDGYTHVLGYFDVARRVIGSTELTATAAALLTAALAS